MFLIGLKIHGWYEITYFIFFSKHSCKTSRVKSMQIMMTLSASFGVWLSISTPVLSQDCSELLDPIFSTHLAIVWIDIGQKQTDNKKRLNILKKE